MKPTSPIAFLALMLACPARSAETCHFTGITDYEGRLAIVADTTALGNTIRVDVRLRLEARPFVFLRTHYEMQEISFWDPDGLTQLAVNNRYSVGSHIVRQQWDVFDRTADGLDAHRIEGKTLVGFRLDHPLFVQHWDPREFGHQWLDDFRHATPERRPDLDLRQMTSGVRPPLAMAFYWMRWLPEHGATIPVFLAGFKDQKRVDLPIRPASTSGSGLPATWQATLRYPELSRTRPSLALAWISPSREMSKLAFDLHGVEYSARAAVTEQGCIGTIAVPPAHRETPQGAIRLSEPPRRAAGASRLPAQ